VLINTGVRYGKFTDNGVVVSASVRDLALGSGIGQLKTVRKALRRLEGERGLIEKIEDGGARKAATYLIKLTQKYPIIQRVNNYGVVSSQTQRIRNPAPNVGTIGPRSGQILDIVYSSETAMMLEDIARRLNIRKDNLKSRHLNTLVDLGLLVEEGGRYATPDDIEARLERELKDSGIEEAERLQRERYERGRERFRLGKVKPVLPVGEEPTPNTVSIPEEPTCLDQLADLETQTPTMRKNLPTRSQDKIFRHGPLCECWMCEEDSPEYLPVEEERTAA